MNRIVMYSGGIGSWYAAKRVIERYGKDEVVAQFTDTMIEDADLYRFLNESTEALGIPLVWLKDGRTPWEVFREKRFLGNTRVDLCSRVLKREPSDRWLAENCDPADTTVYLGIDWTEEHRFAGDDDETAARKLANDQKPRLGARRRYEAMRFRAEAPLCEAPFVTKDQMLAALVADGIEPPRLYALGFAHNNCGGGCVKAGVGHFAHLLEQLPEVYAEWEREEESLRGLLGNVSILRDRTGGTNKRLTLAQLRQRLQGGAVVDEYDIGGCGCFSDDGYQGGEQSARQEEEKEEEDALIPGRSPSME